MADEAQLRLECLKLAEAAKAKGDVRPILEIADIFYDYVKYGRVPAERETKTSSKPSAQSMLPLIEPESNKGLPTIKDMIVTLLKSVEPHGLTAQQILALINQRWWPELKRTSLSPQLSRLKSDGTVVHRQGLYMLPKENAPPAGTDEASSNSEGAA